MNLVVEEAADAGSGEAARRWRDEIERLSDQPGLPMQAPVGEGALRIERPVEIGDHRDAEAALAGNRLKTGKTRRIALDVAGSQAIQRQVASDRPAPSRTLQIMARAQSLGVRSVSGQQIKSRLQALDAVDEQGRASAPPAIGMRRAAARRPASSPPASAEERGAGGALIFRRSVARCVAARTTSAMDGPLKRRRTNAPSAADRLRRRRAACGKGETARSTSGQPS